MNKKFAILVSALGLTFAAHAGVKVTSIDLNTTRTDGFLSIALEGRSRDLPDISVEGRVIEITLSQAEPFDGISKNVKGAQLTANSQDGKAVIRALLPYEVNPDLVNLGWKNKNIEVVFPRGKSAVKVPAPFVSNQMVSKVSKDVLNEDYLNKLMKDNSATKEVAAPTKVEKKDEVKLKQASVAKVEVRKQDNFSFAGYAAKFAVFLAMVLGLFYGIVQVLKKGVFRRGKLGFLNNTKMIEVLSTTYVSPKRSLMIVKAHKQIFLVANSESGLEFLSEMKDTAGLIKEGEKVVTGNNFDTNLGLAETTEVSEVKLKEDITTSAAFEEKGFSKLAVAKDIVKFSDELKKKARKLKPIEFN